MMFLMCLVLFKMGNSASHSLDLSIQVSKCYYAGRWNRGPGGGGGGGGGGWATAPPKVEGYYVIVIEHEIVHSMYIACGYLFD